MLPSDDIHEHFRLIESQKRALKRLGINTISDLLLHLPSRYDSISESATTKALTPGSHVTLFGELSSLKAKKLWKSRRNVAEGTFKDATGSVKVMWFNQPYIANMVPQNTPVKLSGTVAGTAEKPYIANPEVAAFPAGEIPDSLFSDKDSSEETLFPVYPETRGITSKWMYHAIRKILSSDVLEHLHDPIPEKILEAYKLPPLKTALVWIHLPEKRSHTEAARKRFSFEEIFIIQTNKFQERSKSEKENTLIIETGKEKVAEFVSSLPFSLTNAQNRAVDEILSDFEKSHPMARLLEGDVGSGKTAVAAATSYAAVTSRPPKRESGTLQVAYMAPTEILATQHFNSFIELFSHLPINIALITGSGCYKFPSKIDKTKPTNISRAQLLKWVANGEIAMLIGTHALIQKKVEFQNLAYVIVDEQHRFGTAQRRALAKKQGAMPHFLSMTATPIPRTLALTLYGDLDISVLDELPPGRAIVSTEIVSARNKEKMYKKIHSELEKGRQAYVVCPRIEEADPDKASALRVKSAKAEAARLKKEEFPSYEIGLLHGKLTPKEKEAAMESFAGGSTDILVATSVVEVGINVPNATVIIIEGAERFGLAQLHQLRGRVQRSSHEAFCFLLPEKLGEQAKTRLKALEKTSNGFELAEADLTQRGSGDLYGAKQWGISDIGMEALKNPRLIEAARKEASELVKKDPELKSHPALAARVGSITDKLHDE